MTSSYIFHQIKNLFSVLICNLAVADLLFVLTSPVLSVTLFSENFIFGKYFCKIFTGWMYTSMYNRNMFINHYLVTLVTWCWWHDVGDMMLVTWCWWHDAGDMMSVTKNIGTYSQTYNPYPSSNNGICHQHPSPTPITNIDESVFEHFKVHLQLQH